MAFMTKYLLLLCILTTSFFTNNWVYAQIPSLERDALIALYNSTNGDNWVYNAGWKTEPLDENDGFSSIGSETNWHGVTVDLTDSHVTEINLNTRNLTGSIPEEIGNLTYLTEINLSNNGLTGSIPVSFGNLINMTHIDLQENQIDGIIPKELGNLLELDTLNLYSNQLTGNIPVELGDLSELRILNLYINQLTGNIPVELGKLSNLMSLNLHDNNINGSIPVELGGLTMLTYLLLYSNQLTGNIPSELGDLPNLRHLNLTSNQLSGSVPIELFGLKDSLDPNNTDFGFNALYSENETVRTFLREVDEDWEISQTVKPESVVVVDKSSTTIDISWDTIPYFYGDGGYEIYYSTTSGDAGSLFDTTLTKEVDSLGITGLLPNTTYYITIRTVTYSGDNHPADISSEYTEEIVETTTEIPVTTATITFPPVANGYIDGITTQIVELNSTSSPVTADANDGYHFTGWTGGHTGTENPLTITNVTENMTITANFEINTYDVLFNIDPAGGGLINGTASQTISHNNSSAAVTADANDGYHFTRWTGGHTGTENPLTITNVTENMTITANFEINTYDVLFNINPDGGGIITGTASQTISHNNSSAAVTADANDGYHFTRWTGGHTGTENPLTLANVTENMTITANFEIDTIPTHNVSFSIEAGSQPHGSITGELSQTVNSGSACTEVEAVPNAGYLFTGWTGSYVGNENPLTLPDITTDMRVNANFAIDIMPTHNVSFSIEAGSDTHGSITGELSQTVNNGNASTEITAVPNSGYHFTGWQGSYIGPSNPLTLPIITNDMTITATFAINTYDVSFSIEAGSDTHGSITGELSQTVNYGNTCTEVEAVPNSGYIFNGWSGAYEGYENPLTISGMSKDINITAHFIPEIVDTVVSSSGGKGSNGGANCFINTLSH